MPALRTASRWPTSPSMTRRAGTADRQQRGEGVPKVFGRRDDRCCRQKPSRQPVRSAPPLPAFHPSVGARPYCPYPCAPCDHRGRTTMWCGCGDHPHHLQPGARGSSRANSRVSRAAPPSARAEVPLSSRFSQSTKRPSKSRGRPIMSMKMPVGKCFEKSPMYSHDPRAAMASISSTAQARILGSSAFTRVGLKIGLMSVRYWPCAGAAGRPDRARNRTTAPDAAAHAPVRGRSRGKARALRPSNSLH